MSRVATLGDPASLVVLYNVATYRLKCNANYPSTGARGLALTHIIDAINGNTNGGARVPNLMG